MYSFYRAWGPIMPTLSLNIQFLLYFECISHLDHLMLLGAYIAFESQSAAETLRSPAMAVPSPAPSAAGKHIRPLSSASPPSAQDSQQEEQSPQESTPSETRRNMYSVVPPASVALPASSTAQKLGSFGSVGKEVTRGATAR